MDGLRAVTPARVRCARIALFVPHAGCPHRCSFCDQTAIAAEGMPTPEEVRRSCEAALAGGKLDPAGTEIAFFGGSFTAIDRAAMTALLAAAAPFVRAGRVSGIRVSTRPDAVDDAVLAVLKRYGVRAVELGAQSLDDAVLAANGRGHTAAQVTAAAVAVQRAGLELGLQMMTGLYGSDSACDRRTAAGLASLRPATVRIYPTVVLRGTALERLWRAGRYTPPNLDDTVLLCADLLDFFAARDIPVIRLGLHASPALEDAAVAGTWHPALRELCESERWYRRLSARLPRDGAVTARVHPADVSRAVGYRRRNIVRLAADGCALTVRGDASLARGEWKLESGQR